MRYTRIKVNILFLLCACFAISCGENSMKTKEAVAETAPDLKNVTTELPKEAGYHTFIANCSICHSASYVDNQPNFSQKTWTAIVTKMQKTFGAPISDSAAKEIVQYLVAIKGKS